MTAKNRNIPSLRFKEFRGDWKVVRLGEICETFKSGISITSNDIFDVGRFPVYGGNGLRGYTHDYTHEGFYTLIGRQGALCGNINRVYGKSFISEHAIAVSTDKSSDTEWLAQKLDYMKLNRLSESSAQPGLAVNKLVKIKLKIPTLPEQQKIASFLSSIDEKIQQLTRKKELLEQYKKGVMQQLFSGKLRFKPENGKEYPDWESKELGEIINNKSAKYNPEKNKVTYKCIELEHLSTDTGMLLGYVESSNSSSIKSKFEKGDVLFGKLRPYLRKFLLAPFDGVCSSEIWVLKGKGISNDFLFRVIQTEYFIELSNQSTGSKMPRADWKVVSSGVFNIPSIPEQQKIATFLSIIDTKIAYVTNQITQTQTFKKGLLQGMFV